RLGLRRHHESKARGKARDPQYPQRILGKRRADVAQDAGAQILFSAERIDQTAVFGASHGVDGEVPARKILLQRDTRRGVEAESLVSAPGLALGARQRVFLVRFRMQEHRKIAADRSEAAA